MKDNLPNEDFVRCEKCNMPVTESKINFKLYPKIPRFVKLCQKCSEELTDVREQLSDHDKLMILEDSFHRLMFFIAERLEPSKDNNLFDLSKLSPALRNQMIRQAILTNNHVEAVRSKRIKLGGSTNVSIAELQQYVDEFGQKTGFKIFSSKEFEDIISKERANNMTTEQIAQKYCCSTGTVRNVELGHYKN